MKGIVMRVSRIATSMGIGWVSLFLFSVSGLGQTVSEGKPSSIYFDDLSGRTDVEKLLQLPDLIQSKLRTIGIKYSQAGGFPQGGYLHTVVKVIFTSRLHDFREVKEPIDMGSGFAFVGDGRPIFECGSKGFIRFSPSKTTIQDIAFVGPYNNTPPLIVYSTAYLDNGENGETRRWKEKSGRPAKGEPLARGIEVDGGDIQIRGCYFKGFGVVLRCREGQHTVSGMCTFSECFFTNVVQLSDRLAFDQCLIQNSWLLPKFESDKAFIVNYDSLLLRDVLAVPQSDVGTLKNMRWVDHYGLRLDIRTSRFGNETVNKEDTLNGEQVSLVYNWAKYGSTWINAEKTHELENDEIYLIVKDNFLYHRNVPVVKFFEIPNHVIITGNTGLIGGYRIIREKKDYDKSVLCEFAPTFKMPKKEMSRFITINIFDNQKDLKVTAKDPNFLPGTLRYFGPRQRGTQNMNFEKQ
jgi:hypothetical protein